MNDPKITLLTNVISGNASKADFLAVNDGFMELYYFFKKNDTLLRSFNHKVFMVSTNTRDFFNIESGVEIKYRIYAFALYAQPLISSITTENGEELL